MTGRGRLPVVCVPERERQIAKKAARQRQFHKYRLIQSHEFRSSDTLPGPAGETCLTWRCAVERAESVTPDAVAWNHASLF